METENFVFGCVRTILFYIFSQKQWLLSEIKYNHYVPRKPYILQVKSRKFSKFF